MNKVIALSIFLGFAFGTSKLCAQETKISTLSSHSLSFKTQVIQIKDDFTYGLVFSGPNVALAYDFYKERNELIYTYSPEIAFGGVFNKGAGFAWRFKPIDVFIGKKLKSKALDFGAYFATDYQWQQYSELQGGRLFWFSTIEIGPRLSYQLPYKSNLFRLNFSNSIAGFISRPEAGTEEYFYQFSLLEFINVANQNLEFGSFNLFNRSQFGIDYQRTAWKHISLTYQFETFGYYKAPDLRFINHTLEIHWLL